MKSLIKTSNARIISHLLSYLFVCLIFSPFTANAAELTGRIEVGAIGEEIFPGKGVNRVPLKEVRVLLGVLEFDPDGPIEALFTLKDETVTDANGGYSFNLGEDDPDVPPEDIAHAIVILLESKDSAITVFDHEEDPNNVACLGSKLIDVSTHGLTLANIDLTVLNDNDATYAINVVPFEPTEEKSAQPIFGFINPACNFTDLTTLGQGGYDQRGLTNSKRERFAHMAVHYARAYDAYEFVRDDLGMGGFSPVRVNAFDSRADSWAYKRPTRAITIHPDFSVFFNPEAASDLFAMRHEYGHHFMFASRIAGIDTLPPLATGEGTHDGIFNATSAGSWIEGFATFFAAAVADSKGEDRPYEQVFPGGEINLLFGGARLDIPSVSGEQRGYGLLSEEFAIASLLWDVSEITGSGTLVQLLEAQTFLTLNTFADVYTALLRDSTIGSSFIPVTCNYPDTGAVANGIDCPFIERGFYHDKSGDGLYGPGEVVGSTRWSLTMHPDPNDFRRNVPVIEGSMLRLHTVDGDGQPISVDGFKVEIQYDAPLAHANSEYVRAVTGDGPYEFHILVPAKPSRAIITAMKDDLVSEPSLVIESDFFHDHIDPLRSGGVTPLLAEHIFAMKSSTENPAPSSPGNRSPSTPDLVAPANGQTGLSNPVTFEWNGASDPDGDTLNYELIYCEDIDLTDACNTVQVAALLGKSIQFTAMSYGTGLFLMGVVLCGGRWSRKKIVMSLAILSLTGMFLASCSSSGGSGGQASTSGEFSTTISGLKSGTTYFWKVTANDGLGGTTDSEVRRFTTQ